MPTLRHTLGCALILLTACTPSKPTPDPPPRRPGTDSTPGTAPEPETAAEPEPEPEPTPEPEPEPPSFGHADLDPDNDGVLGPPAKIDDCHAELDARGIVYKKAKLGLEKKVRGVYTCGSHEAVWMRHGPTELRYSSSPLLSCPMALAMPDFEQVVQEEAERLLGSRVARIDFMSTYACRKMARFDMISEHSFANAMDVSRFRLANGEVVSVLDDFGPTDAPPPDAKAEFLRTVASRLYDEQVFSTVLTPYFDHLHRNHFHLDLARYRVDGSRP